MKLNNRNTAMVEMKKYLVILFLIVSISGFANSSTGMDTISYWQVRNGGELIKENNILSEDSRVILTKGTIKAIDTLNVRYFDDTLCINCNASLVIKTEKGDIIREIGNSKSNYDFDIKTTDIQVLVFENRSSILRFYYREDESVNEILLFEVEVK